MTFRRIVRLPVAGVIIISPALWAAAPEVAGTCPSDAKVLNGGPTKIFGEGPGTWWELVINGLLTAGFVEEDDQINYLNQIFNTDFDCLDELKAYNLQLVQDTWDENHNGYVCAFQLRGTPANFNNPYLDLTFFGVTDDREEIGVDLAKPVPRLVS